MRLLLLLLATVFSGCTADSPVLKGGQWTLVNYWAIWCKPCREEVPALNALNARDDLRVFGVNFDRKVGAALTTDVAELGIEFAITDDPSTLLGTERPRVLPTTLIVSPSGELVATLVGPQTAASIEATLAMVQ